MWAFKIKATLSPSVKSSHFAFTLSIIHFENILGAEGI